MQPILTINLSTGEIGKFIIPRDWERDFLGGASLAARILYEYPLPELQPLSPEAPLLFLNGPLSGTAGPAVGRFVICARSPATGLWGESNCGGFWGPELRKTGYDGLLLSGRAESPVYLWIHQESDGEAQVELREASHLWGLETYAAQSAVRQELGSGTIRVASIGPAGEAEIPFALILCDHGRVAGRTGMGAVMGSKNLKAVAVKGFRKIPVADAAGFAPLRSDANKALREDSQSRVLHDLGSAGAAEYFDYLGEMPKRYFQFSSYPEELKISGAHVKETILVGETTCHACVIACGRVVQLPRESEAAIDPKDSAKDPFSNAGKRKGPEYETLVGFGPNLWLNDEVAATRLGELCDRYGMDTISLSNTIGLAISLFEKGIIDVHDTGGIELRWGDAEMVERLIHLTARREGFGACLAEGARDLARRFRAEEEAVQVNGLEVAYHDPRGASGMALVYATSPRGACHNQSDYFMADIGQVEAGLGLEYFSPHDGEEKAANVARHQDWRTVFNALVMCFFANVPPDTVLGLINSACGLDFTKEEMLKAGERGWNLKRVINNRLGLGRSNDKLPKALLEPYQDAQETGKGAVPNFERMLNAYYQVRGWDPVTGFPSQAKLAELGLDWAARDLDKLQANT